jgi:hypothetical protein
MKVENNGIDMQIENRGIGYLSHPITTYGSVEDNVASSVKIQNILIQEYGLSILNPATSVNKLLSWADAMEKCRTLYKACDVLILCPNWHLSKGCQREAKWALCDKKPIYYFSYIDGANSSLDIADKEDVKKLLNVEVIYTGDQFIIQQDKNNVYIDYFGDQYILSKNVKRVMSSKAEDNVRPEDYVIVIGARINLWEMLPEKFHNLLTQNKKYSFFLCKQSQLCIKSEDESIYMNKYNAYTLMQILLYKTGTSDSHKNLFWQQYCRVTTFNGGDIVKISYYVEPDGKAVNFNYPLFEHTNYDIDITYNELNKSVKIAKEKHEFSLTPLETHYLQRLLLNNVELLEAAAI